WEGSGGHGFLRGGRAVSAWSVARRREDPGTPPVSTAPCTCPCYSLDRLRFSTAAAHVVSRSETPMDVVIDHADVLHEGVHTRGPHEVVSLRLQLFGECFRLRRRLGEIRERSRRTLVGWALVGLRERS